MFNDLIISWYLKNKRDLPWRNTSDPYRIWISEIILQQTRVAQGLSYYNRFIERFPNVSSLAAAEEDEVLKYWQGLGYYSRARNIHFAAKTVASAFNGIFPSDYDSVRSLKGIGDYTAAAICSFAFGLPCAVVDGNVYRVLSRVFEIDTPIDCTEGKKQFAVLARELLDEQRPALHNQAIMDLGALVCTPTSPACSDCPLAELCLAFEHHSQTDFPVKSKSTKQHERYFTYFYIRNNGKTYLHRRDAKDIWKGLYEFPMIETARPIADFDLLSEDWMRTLAKEFSDMHIVKMHPVVKHVLSHQIIFALFVEAEANYLSPHNSLYVEIAESDVEQYAVSRLTEMFLNHL